MRRSDFSTYSDAFWHALSITKAYPNEAQAQYFSCGNCRPFEHARDRSEHIPSVTRPKIVAEAGGYLIEGPFDIGDPEDRARWSFYLRRLHSLSIPGSADGWQLEFRQDSSNALMTLSQLESHGWWALDLLIDPRRWQRISRDALRWWSSLATTMRPAGLLVSASNRPPQALPEWRAIFETTVVASATDDPLINTIKEMEAAAPHIPPESLGLTIVIQFGNREAPMTRRDAIATQTLRQSIVPLVTHWCDGHTWNEAQIVMEKKVRSLSSTEVRTAVFVH